MDAEEQKKKLMEQNKIKDGMMFKMDDDPRIIKGIGHFIRKTSIDEFPQFLNVLKGDMSMNTRSSGRRLWTSGKSILPGIGSAWRQSRA